MQWEVYGYVAQFEPYQGLQKSKQLASSTKWELGESVDLWLMNINNYFTFFCQLAHLGVNKIRATIKTGYTNALSLDQTAAKKRNVTTLNSAHQTEKVEQFWQWLERQQGSLYSFF